MNRVGEGGQFWHKPFLPVCTIRNISVWGRNLGIPGKGALAQASSLGIAKFLVSVESSLWVSVARVSSLTL